MTLLVLAFVILLIIGMPVAFVVGLVEHIRNAHKNGHHGECQRNPGIADFEGLERTLPAFGAQAEPIDDEDDQRAKDQEVDHQREGPLYPYWFLPL